ncbi:MAG: tRNA (adenosine(37)-N6)-dimethylallyltransferase MiaA [Hyphomicrobiales bacterium]|nr:tRNA (adenosine(37)-N6)-dimethylallyltransferase MiaA [Hyphomicrobiales bacterium]MCY4033737.1 tRNA (adenosine(37)-N6)-dimethylallyltransferase MiaA [Hyphomicrobiales bacterium]MCY4038804.1 tRNA (adenosine(37)-N6)-dimethylallyltransferase MiaA [Hyphomicrobiales bacterium]
MEGILVAGPTASGKSALAMTLAEQFGGEIINADVMQSYREVRILSARPGPEDEKRLPHHLYGYRNAQDDASVANWMEEASTIIAACKKSERVPVVVGGASLYITCFDQGLAQIPPVPSDIRASVRERIENEGVGACYAMLEKTDPRLAQRIAPGDKQRIARGLEVFEATGKPLTDWQEETHVEPPSRNYLRLLLEPERALVYQRCEQRFDAMMSEGALEEVDGLRDARGDIPPALKHIHGVAPLLSHLRGEISLAKAVSAAKQHTRNYAKRQTTWARHRLGGWHRLGVGDSDETIGKALSLAKPDLIRI